MYYHIPLWKTETMAVGSQVQLTPPGTEMQDDQKIQGLIFDFDGLILDTETPIFQSWLECYREYGHDLDLVTFSQCIGTDFAVYDPSAELDRLVGRALDWSVLHGKRRERMLEILNVDPRPMPGIEALLQEAKDEGIPCAIASSSSMEWVGGWIDRLGLKSFFEAIVTVDQVQHPKPSSELFVAAAQRLGKSHDELIILEDSMNGLQAAKAAGIDCVVVPNRLTSHMEFEGAVGRLNSLGETNLYMLQSMVS